MLVIWAGIKKILVGIANSTDPAQTLLLSKKQCLIWVSVFWHEYSVQNFRTWKDLLFSYPKSNFNALAFVTGRLIG